MLVIATPPLSEGVVASIIMSEAATAKGLPELAILAFVGAGNPSKNTNYPHHHEKFAIDEDSLEIGTALYA